MVLSYDMALRDVIGRVKKSKTSFMRGMMHLPRARREAMYGFYAFCREVDDIADDSPNAKTRRIGLQKWRGYIKKLFAGHASESITTVLLPAVKAYRLVPQDFYAIIEGMEIDARKPVIAPRMKQLDHYCDCVASAVGRVSVRIFGDASKDAMQVAHHLGRGLQLTNILRDLHEDAMRGRCYLPHEMLMEYKIAPQSPRDILKNKNLPKVCRKLARVAQDHFTNANRAMKKCKAGSMTSAEIMRDYYGAILKKLILADWQNPEKRITLSVWQKLVIALRMTFR